MEYQTVYFDERGSKNTDETLEIVQKFAEQKDIDTIVIASASGSTGIRALEILKDRNLVVVTHATGFRNDNEQELLPENREKIESMGGRILTCQHALAGISRAVRFKYNTYQIDEIVANTLRIFGQGLKVTVELCLMAADAGLIRTDADVIAVGGTGTGADTAAVIRPAHVARFFDIKVRGILCKPWDF